MALDVVNFHAEVIEKSHTVPVLVDFWADWCGPCKILGPVLERLAAQNDGQWVLAKVNTEEHADLARQYNIQSIPNVKLFVDGAVVDEFVGALPEYQLQRWLQKAIPGKSRKILEQAEALLKSGNESSASQLLQQIPPTDPDYTEARILLARCLIFENPVQAAALIEDIEEPQFAEILETVRTLARLHQLALQPGQLPDGDGRRLYLAAITSVVARDYEAALKQFIDVIRENRYFDDDGSRKACIALFRVLGEDHPLTQQYRRVFSSALY